MYNLSWAIPTPHIDKLAMSGVRLESYYVNQLCRCTTPTSFLCLLTYHLTQPYPDVLTIRSIRLLYRYDEWQGSCLT